MENEAVPVGVPPSAAVCDVRVGVRPVLPSPHSPPSPSSSPTLAQEEGVNGVAT
jgi:hypothetical protein